MSGKQKKYLSIWWIYLGLTLVEIGYLTTVKTMLVGIFMATFTLLAWIYDRPKK